MLSVDRPDVKQCATKGSSVLERTEGTLEMAQLWVDNAAEHMYDIV